PVSASGSTAATATFSTSSLSVGTHTITAVFAPASGRPELVGSTSNAVTLPVNQTPPPVVAVAFAVGAGVGREPLVIVYGSDGSQHLSFLAYDASFTAGVRVAVGDVNGDGTLDIITAPGPGTQPLIKVFDGASQSQSTSFLAYDAANQAGVYLAAGDFENRGAADILVGPGS